MTLSVELCCVRPARGVQFLCGRRCSYEQIGSAIGRFGESTCCQSAPSFEAGHGITFMRSTESQRKQERAHTVSTRSLMVSNGACQPLCE
eukprot:1358963-Amphidinium_carterae.2